MSIELNQYFSAALLEKNSTIAASLISAETDENQKDIKIHRYQKKFGKTYTPLSVNVTEAPEYKQLQQSIQAQAEFKNKVAQAKNDEDRLRLAKELFTNGPGAQFVEVVKTKPGGKAVLNEIGQKFTTAAK